MAEHIWGADPNLTLEELGEWVHDKEGGYGPLIDIGHTADGTAGTFRYQTGQIAMSELRMILAEQELTVPGKTEICRGEVFIQDSLRWVAVFR